MNCIKAVLKVLLSSGGKKCLWIKLSEGWLAKCSGYHHFKPEDNYCPYCGKEIEVTE